MLRKIPEEPAALFDLMCIYAAAQRVQRFVERHIEFDQTGSEYRSGFLRHLYDFRWYRWKRKSLPRTDRVLRFILARVAEVSGSDKGSDKKRWARMTRQAWHAANGGPQPGRKSVKDYCFDALVAGHWKLGMHLPPNHPGYVPDTDTDLDYMHWKQWYDDLCPHVRPTQSALIQMICGRYSNSSIPIYGAMNIKASTAKKYAQQWEAEMYPRALPVKDRRGRPKKLKPL